MRIEQACAPGEEEEPGEREDGEREDAPGCPVGHRVQRAEHQASLPHRNEEHVML